MGDHPFFSKPCEELGKVSHSPLLYILMADSLSRNLEPYKMEWKLPGIHIAPSIQAINHSFFNSIFLGGA
jgi:hypothetical protein